MMVVTKKTVLITGCSDGGMGAALALAFHKANYHVYATARNPQKMEGLASAGIETLTLDVLSDLSIAECVAKVPQLDVLVNNAGSQFLMPVVDVNIAEAKKLYDLNVWAHIAVIQAFLPHLLDSKGIIVNQTSVGASIALPFQAVYNSSKAAFAMLSNSLRLEIECFGIRVVDLRTGVVKTNLIKNLQDSDTTTLPKGSIYEPARDAVEKSLRQEGFEGGGLPAQQWAAAVVQDLSKKTPPAVIWRGEQSMLSRIVAMLPLSWVDGLLKQVTGMDKVEVILKK